MKLRFSAQDVVTWTHGTQVSGIPDAEFSEVGTDTRSLASGALFVAICGTTHDAHRFLDGAVSAGAGGLLVNRDAPLPDALPPTFPVIRADDTTRALGDLARGHRAGFDGPVVAITGSNGKTTTKEMCATILETRAPCLRNQGNWNNQYGLPLTLLQRRSEQESIVVELGMNHRGEIAHLAGIAAPRVGVVTNIGTAHIEHLGSRDAIAAEKGDLLAALPSSGVAVVNADDSFAELLAARSPARVLRFGLKHGDVRSEGLADLGNRGVAFDLCAPEGRVAVHIQGLGETTVANALAAAAAALAAGCSLAAVAEGLALHRPVAGRMEPLALPRNIILINDTYNANPQSMEVALCSLAELKGSSRGIAVLGDMGELGGTAADAHRDMGRRTAELGIDFLFALGSHAGEIEAGALEAGMDPARVHISGDHKEISDALSKILQGNDWVLVKGSRAMRMERIVTALSNDGVPS